MSILDSNHTYNALKTALNGLSLRSQMISRNISNVDTPGYQAQNVSFEQTVQQAMKKEVNQTLSTTNVSHIQPEEVFSGFIRQDRPGGTDRADGNDVDIDTELTQMGETAMKYQALTQLINKKFNMIKTITMSR